MKARVTAICVFALVALSEAGYAQPVEVILSQAKASAITRIKREASVVKWSQIQLQVFPTLYFDIDCEQTDSLRIKRISLDTAKYLAILKSKAGYKEYYGQLSYLILQIKAFGSSNLVPWRTSENPDIEVASSVSDNVFLLSLARGLRSPILLDKVASYIINEGHQFIVNRQSVGSISELVRNRFGSIEKFCELKEEETNLHSLMKLDQESTRRFLQNSFRLHCKYFPADTANALNLFMTEMSLESHQRSLLQGLILFALRSKSLSDGSGPIDFYGDVTPILKEVLTYEQLCAYTKKAERLQRAESILSDGLFYAYCHTNNCQKDSQSIMRMLIYGK